MIKLLIRPDCSIARHDGGIPESAVRFNAKNLEVAILNDNTEPNHFASMLAQRPIKGCVIISEKEERRV